MNYNGFSKKNLLNVRNLRGNILVMIKTDLNLTGLNSPFLSISIALKD